MYFVGTVTYYVCNIDEIIEKYCINKETPELKCNGKCHLAKTAQIAEKNDTSPLVSLPMAELISIVFYEKINNILLRIIPVFKKQSRPIYNGVCYYQADLNSIDPPPRV